MKKVKNVLIVMGIVALVALLKLSAKLAFFHAGPQTETEYVVGFGGTPEAEKEEYETDEMYSEIQSKADQEMVVKILQTEKQYEMLDDMNNYLSARCEFGEKMEKLNSWEQNFFYIYELWEEVNSDGFDGYLYYRGIRFYPTKKAAEEVGIQDLVSLMEKVEKKFPDGKVPKNEEKIQDLLDEEEFDFEKEDEEFYEKYDAILADCLEKYVRKSANVS
jgi:hypothetical protein